eukprot:TRINITY_DN44_c0_g1_i4.p3 TRINITY_DN44_c0_g1~~TRINITY_DN44_c0_g1_i4.p3  ORF type:complete len:127 (+),score=72.79 TRINITY_DN44_c0_g1_i4:63-443(+)
MSWQSYVDDSLVGAGHVHKAALLGHDGNTWATSAGFAVTPTEGAALAALFNTPANAFSTGITAAGTKYLALKADGRPIYGKKGSSGVLVVKTGQAIIVGVYNEGIQPGAAVNGVEKVADYLVENGY